MTFWFNGPLTPKSPIKLVQVICLSRKFLTIHSTKPKVSYIARVTWLALYRQIGRWNETWKNRQMNQKWIRGRGSDFGALGKTLREISRPRVRLVLTPQATKTFFQDAAFHVVWMVLCSPMPTQPERDKSGHASSFPGLFASRFIFGLTYCFLRKREWNPREAKLGVVQEVTRSSQSCCYHICMFLL